MFAGIDIGGTSIKYAILDKQGAVISKDSIATDAQSGKDAVLIKLRNIIADLQSRSSLHSIGIGFPSVVNPITGVVYHPPNLQGWAEFALRDELSRDCSIPIVIENDANVAAYAETSLGAGRDLNHFLYVTLGTGIGGAIISDGKIFHGESGGAGEIGHTIIDAREELVSENQLSDRAYRVGTLEEFTGRAAILRRARQLAVANPDSMLNGYRAESFDVSDLSVAAEAGDDCALQCFRDTGYYLGIGIASALALLGMTKVVIGGGVANAHTSLFASIRATLRQRSLPAIAPHIEVRHAQFAEEAGVIGAAMLAKNFMTN